MVKDNYSTRIMKQCSSPVFLMLTLLLLGKFVSYDGHRRCREILVYSQPVILGSKTKSYLQSFHQLSEQSDKIQK